MKIFSIAGKADKRPLTYPFLKILALAGHTLVITDDPAYRRLYRGYEKEGEICNIKITVIPELSEDKIDPLISAIGENEYDYIILITESFCYMEADACLCVCARNISFFGTKLDEFSEKYPEAKKVFMPIGVFDKKAWRNAATMVLPWNDKNFSYIYSCEEAMTLLPFNDKLTLEILGVAFRQQMGLTERAFVKAAQRKLV